jgi:bifunctional DNA-binding transcriptional regulator/antitoxin component of YhaV-PrlF toxin-antitoxin module
METRVTTDGQVALPESLRMRLGIRAGDTLYATVEQQNGGQRIVLTPQQPEKKYELKLITDPLTGWPVLSAGPNAPIMTSEDVAELLVDFP